MLKYEYINNTMTVINMITYKIGWGKWVSIKLLLSIFCVQQMIKFTLMFGMLMPYNTGCVVWVNCD